MEAFVGALLSTSMDMFLEKIASGEFADLFRRTELDVALLDEIDTTMASLQSLLPDAENKQINNPGVKKWLNKLHDAVFEAEDLFDEINTEALRCEVEDGQFLSVLRCEVEAGQFLKEIFSFLKRFINNPNSKLSKLSAKLKHVKNQNPGLNVGDFSTCVVNVTPTTPFLVKESNVKGREDDKEKLKKFLLSEDGCDSEQKIGVISIVGMGGLGKTTLAKLLYNDHHVKEEFKVRGWSHIPKSFDLVAVTKTILESVTSKTIKESNFVELQMQLQQSLSNKKFLLVLDDMSHGNYVDWNSLSDIFNVGQTGSKIIITTRDERVVLPRLKSLDVHHLSYLGTEESWSLLAIHAFVEKNCEQYPNLEEIGREIVKKCCGLPLAVVTLGGILRTKLSSDYWSDVLNSSIWKRTSGDVQPSLVIFACENLEFLSHESFHKYTSLERLEIHGSCNPMTSFILCSFPLLKKLVIYGCKHLKSILIVEDASKQNLLFLRSISIHSCSELESISISGIPIPNLTYLSVCRCEKLRSLPESIKTLTSLQEMRIVRLPNLQSFSINDLPISLPELEVGNVGGILGNTTWEHLTSLAKLSINGDDIVKELMKTQVPLLPTNLVYLKFFGLKDIECLDGKWLQHLTSLHTLEIEMAPKLKLLPEKRELPSSLKELFIHWCPLLEESLRRKQGIEWSKICQIPSIYIDLEIIK